LEDEAMAFGFGFGGLRPDKTRAKQVHLGLQVGKYRAMQKLNREPRGNSLMNPKSNRISALMVATLGAAFGVQSAWSDMTLKIIDTQNKPIAGVSCSVVGGTPSVSDANGSLVLSKDVSSILATRRIAAGGASLSQIPLASGEKATLTVLNVKGQKLLSRQIALGDRVPFMHPEHGVFFVDIAARGWSTRGHFANLGNPIVFEGIGVANEPAKMFAKTSAAGTGIGIVCSKAGMPSQVFQVIDGPGLQQTPIGAAVRRSDQTRSGQRLRNPHRPRDPLFGSRPRPAFPRRPVPCVRPLSRPLLGQPHRDHPDHG
jgi:hypothetical protein